MQRELKKMVLGLVLAGATAVTSLPAFAGNGGKGGGNGNSSQSSNNNSARVLHTNNGGFNTQVMKSNNSLPLQNVTTHPQTTIKKIDPVFSQNGNTGINGHNLGIKVPNLSNGNSNSNSNPLHTVKKIDPGIGNGQSGNSNSHPMKKIDPGFGNGPNKNSNNHHNAPVGKSFYCGKNPCWTFPINWWLPSPNFCTHHHYCTPIYPVNVITIIEHVTVTTPGVDLMLESVGAIDSGNPAAGLGPNYRVTIRNNSLMPVGGFNVMLMGGMDQTPRQDAPASVVRIDAMQSGQLMTFDVRLPVNALMMARDAAGQPVPMSNLFVAVDSNETMPDINRTNNGAVLPVNTIPVVLQ